VAGQEGETIPKNAFPILIGFGGIFRDFTVGADFACLLREG
jgi:hypothetical protein